LLEQGIFLPKPASRPHFRSQFLEVFYPDVLRGPAYPCAIWKAHVDLTDYTAPVTTATIRGKKNKNGYYSPVTVDLKTADASTIGQPAGCSPLRTITRFSVDGEPWVEGLHPTISSNRLHTLRFRSTDVPGNIEPIQTLDLLLLP
jgi:hypothetical protein